MLNAHKIDDTLAYINEIVAERQQTYNLIKAELKVANTKKLHEMCLKQQNVNLTSFKQSVLSTNIRPGANRGQPP